MKKSEIYRICQLMVLHEGSGFVGDDKLAILRELMAQEDLARFSEEQAAKEARV